MLIFLTELAEGNEELAVDRHENLTQLSLSCLATMLNIPLEMDTGADGRRKVRGKCIGVLYRNCTF